MESDLTPRQRELTPRQRELTPRQRELTQQQLRLQQKRLKKTPNLDHLKILNQGVNAWNIWREKHPNIRPDLKGANLLGKNLEGVNFEQTDLTGACLKKANLKRSNLKHAKLIRALLEQAHLEEAKLIAADLTVARLEGANLTAAKLNKAILIGTVLAAEKPSDMAAILTGAELRDIKFTPKGELVKGGSFLDLASCIGLETAKFSGPGFLEAYLTAAFEYAHRINIPEKKRWPNFVAQTIRNIRALQTIYASALKPGQLVEIVSIITAELVEYLKRHPEALYQIRPRQFEVLVAEILSSYGWQVQLTPAIKDGGYDIFAISKEVQLRVKNSWIIECKKYARENKIGVEIVQRLYGIKSHLKVANALLATTSFFTKGAMEFKASRYDIELKDYHDLIEWINEYSPNPNGKLYLKNNRLIVPGED